MDINTFVNFIQYVANKSQSGRTWTPQEIAIVIPAAQYNFILNEIKDWQKITEDIRVLKKTIIFTPDSNGIAPLPDDYMMFETDVKKYITALRYTTTQTVIDSCGDEQQEQVLVPIEYVGEDEWATRSISEIKKPSSFFPIAKFNASTISFMPVLPQVTMTYLRQPVKPVWNFTPDPITETPVFNPIGSVNIEFPEHTHVKIAYFVLSIIGINLSFDKLISYAETMKVQN